MECLGAETKAGQKVAAGSPFSGHSVYETVPLLIGQPVGRTKGGGRGAGGEGRAGFDCKSKLKKSQVFPPWPRQPRLPRPTLSPTPYYFYITKGYPLHYSPIKGCEKRR